RFERRGLRVAALKLMQLSEPLARRHYAVHEGKFFFDDLVRHITSGPVVVAVLEGPNAIQVVRLMVGATRPHEAQPGTIRGDFALAGLRNLVHASDAPATAASETALYFTPDELVAYTRELDRWIVEG
ncbi:MAG: nucleoside-diphosphate kinase, partial [Actinobacteria bacterium]|nr:nucleoside-diphosphate kinase [Actinomycetota bacterium]